MFIIPSFHIQLISHEAPMLKVPWWTGFCLAGKGHSITMIWWQNCPQFNVTWAVGPKHKAPWLSLQKVQTVRYKIVRRDRWDVLICRHIVQRRFQGEIQTAQSRIPITSPRGEESFLFSVDYCCQTTIGDLCLCKGDFFDSSSCRDCAPAALMNGCRLCFCPFLHEAAVK